MVKLQYRDLLSLNARLKGTVAILAAKLYSGGYISISLSLDKVKVDAFNDDNGNLIRKKNWTAARP